MSQFQRALFDSLPGSFLLDKQALKRFHKDSTGFHNTPSSSDCPRSLTGLNYELGGTHCSKKRESADNCDLNLVSQHFSCPCHGGSKEGSDSSKHLCIWLSRSCTGCEQPGPRTAHEFCHSFGAVHFENPQFQVMKALGSQTSGKQISQHCSKQVHDGYTDIFKSQKAQRTLAQGSIIMIYQIHCLHLRITAVFKFLAVAWRIPRTEVPEKLGCFK